MKSNLICMLITIVAYLILMIVVGILASKKNKDTSDFYLGGRKLGPIVTAMSAEASDMSSYLLMGLPGLALLTLGSPMSAGQSSVWQSAHISTGYSSQNGCEFILSTTARLQFQTFSRTAITITNIS